MGSAPDTHATHELRQGWLEEERAYTERNGCHTYKVDKKPSKQASRFHLLDTERLINAGPELEKG